MKLQNGEVILKNIFPKRLFDKTQEMMFEGIDLGVDGQPKMSDMKMQDALDRSKKVEEYKILQMIESIKINDIPKDVTEKIFDEISLPDYKKILKEIDKIAGLDQELPLQSNSK